MTRRVRRRLCAADAVPEGAARGFCIRHGDAELQLLLVRGARGLRAYLNSCPHTGVTLDWQPDRFLDEAGRHLQCATHGALFRIEDGFCIAGPCAGQSLTPLALEERPDGIDLLLPEPPGETAATGKIPGKSLQ